MHARVPGRAVTSPAIIVKHWQFAVREHEKVGFEDVEPSVRYEVLFVTSVRRYCNTTTNALEGIYAVLLTEKPPAPDPKLVLIDNASIVNKSRLIKNPLIHTSFRTPIRRLR